MSDYPVSVIVASLRGWRVFSNYFYEDLRQVRSLGGQMIVADGTGGHEPMEAGAEDVVWLRMPGATPVQLRQAAYRQASAPIVAVIEDHCRPAEDWLTGVMDAHAADPEAAVIFGSVENGSREHLIDWAIYFVGYGPFAPPVPETVANTPGNANVSWKRWALEKVPATGDRVLEFRYIAALKASGGRVATSDLPAVTHFQCDDLPTSADLMYSSGRAIAGLRRRTMEPADWVRAFLPLPIAGYRTLRTARAIVTKPRMRRPALAALPLIAFLHAAHTFGETIGYATGTGDAFMHLH
jgi:hypothetical protein